MFKFSRKQNDLNEDHSIEEVSERRTSKLGYVILILMAIFLIGISQTIFRDLANVPEEPQKPSSCIRALKNENRILKTPVEDCRFNEIDKQFSLDTKYINILPFLEEVINLQKEIKNWEKSLQHSHENLADLEKHYALSLQEEMADGEVKIYENELLQDEITLIREGIAKIEASVIQLKTSLREKNSEIALLRTDLIASYDQAYDAYQSAIAWYKLKILGLHLLFVVPLFGFAVRYYLRCKHKNSPYTIIWTTLVGVLALLLLQVVWSFLYTVILSAWIASILKFLLSIPALRYIVYYGVIFLIVALFGGIVYLIQKRIFNPTKIAVRHLREKKCPNCSFALTKTDIHCANCGIKLKEPCPQCGQQRSVHLAFCTHCGDKKSH